MNKFVRRHWLIILILALATFMRLYNLSGTITFLEDEARDVLIVKKMLDTHRPIALGPQTSTGNMYLGPFYYYFITPALVLSNFDPIGPAILIALTGILTTYLLYRWGTKWFGRQAGIVASLLFAIMPGAVYMTRNSWNPNLAPLVSLIFVYYFQLVLQTKSWSKANIFKLGLLASILVQLHYITLVLLLVSALIYLIYHRQSPRKLFVGAVLAIIGFVIPLLPFIVFEVKNSYPNGQAIVKYLKAEDEPNLRYNMPLKAWQYRISIASTRVLSSLFGNGQFTKNDQVNSYISTSFLVVTLFSLFSYLRQKQRNRYYLPLVLLFAGSLMVLGVYQENMHIHYLGYLFPLVFLLAGYFVSNSGRLIKLVSSLFFIFSIIYTFPTIFNYVTTSESIQVSRTRAVSNYIVDRAGNAPYNIVPFRDTQLAAPFEYFLALSDHPPSSILTEKLFVICVDRACDQTDFEFEWIFRKGPSHPSIAEYLGHPFYDSFEKPITLLNMEHVDHGIWVAETQINLQ